MGVDAGPPPLPLFPTGHVEPGKVAVAMPDATLTYGELEQQVSEVASAIRRSGGGPGDVVAVPALAQTSTVVGLLGALASGCAAVPVNTGGGPDEVRHVVDDARPMAVVWPGELELPAALEPLPRVWATPGPDGDGTGSGTSDAPLGDDDPADARAAALVVYTSGTTGPPKGVVLSHGALAVDLDALADAWGLVGSDVLVHALPLFHVHGLVLATLGPLRVGATVHHLGRFSAEAVADRIGRGATVHYGVPTMYHRLADALVEDPSLAASVGRARLLVSGSAGLAAHDRDRITAATGLPVLERYGMTETLITCAATVTGGGEPGTVGPPLPGVELVLVDDDGMEVESTDHDTVGEILVRGATLFSGYLGRPEATAACFTPDGWFRTGDLGTWSSSGAVRISGRRSVDLIKSAGYRIGAGEIENVLLRHPAVAEVAVTGEPDPDLGERIVAWVVPVTGSDPDPEELVAHVGEHLARHKTPREVRFLTALPRNELGKVLKRSLG